jgi:serine protease Do
MNTHRLDWAKFEMAWPRQTQGRFLRATRYRLSASHHWFLVLGISAAVWALMSSTCWGQVAETSTLTVSTSDPFASLEQTANDSAAQLGILRMLVKATGPSVAHIEAKKTKGKDDEKSSSARASFIEEAGSGVVIRHRGRFFVVTNYHVIEGADVKNIQIEVGDKAMRPTDIRHDKDSDISVMLLGTESLQPARLGDSDNVEIGDYVVAIGSPFGLSHSVSHGIISAKNRHDLELGPQGVKYQDFFQTDASINPGNSGGPLFNLKGEVIGVNTAIASNSGGSDGIGFSIPINMAMRIVTDLIDLGYVKRGFLGVTMDGSFSSQMALEMGLDRSHGALVSAITPGTPAAQAGVVKDDLIIEFGGRLVQNDSHLVTLVSLAQIGDKIPVKLIRAKQLVDVEVVIRERDE